jgi:uncharacterized protein (DUF983 family)
MGINTLFIRRAEWVPYEFTKEFESGGSIRIRGHRCTGGGFFRHYKNDVSPYCENCGAFMKKKEVAA